MLKFFNKLNNPMAVVIAVVLFLVLNAFLFYRYQQQSLPSAIDVLPSAVQIQPGADATKDDGTAGSSSAPEASGEFGEDAVSEGDAGTEDAAIPEESAAVGEGAVPEGGAGTEEAAIPEESAAAGEGADSLGEPVALQVVVSVVDTPTWLSIQGDGQTVLEGVREPGFSQEFDAEQQMTISSGDGGAVVVEMNGYNLGPLGARGEASTRTFTAGP